MQPNMFPICIFYFHVHALSFKLTDIYVLVWIQKMCTYYRVWPRTVIVNYILCMYLNCTMHCLIIVQNILEPCSAFIKTIFKYKLSFKKWNHPIKNDTYTSKTFLVRILYSSLVPKKAVKASFRYMFTNITKFFLSSKSN